MHNDIPTMLTVREAAAKFTGLKEYRIRELIKSGELPAVKCGNRNLICEQVLINFLYRGNNHPQAEPPNVISYGKIRPIAE